MNTFLVFSLASLLSSSHAFHVQHGGEFQLFFPFEIQLNPGAMCLAPPSTPTESIHIRDCSAPGASTWSRSYNPLDKTYRISGRIGQQLLCLQVSPKKQLEFQPCSNEIVQRFIYENGVLRSAAFQDHCLDNSPNELMIRALNDKTVKAAHHYVLDLKLCQIPNHYYFSSGHLQVRQSADPANPLKGWRLTIGNDIYVLGTEIGKGHNAVVYDLQGSNEYVIKVFKDNQRRSTYEQMDEEIDILERLGEYVANGVTHDVHSNIDRAFLVMKRVFGVHLSSSLLEEYKDRIPQQEFEEAIKQARRALYVDHHIVHNDAKLNNIFLDINLNRTPRVIARFIDFGQSRWFPSISDEMKEKIRQETENLRKSFVTRGGIQPLSDMMPDM